MKVALLFLVLGSAMAFVPMNDKASVSLAQMQRDVNALLIKVTEPICSSYPTLKEAAENFIPEENGSLYKDGGEAVSILSKEIKDFRVLKKHHWFSLFNDRHRAEALMLFRVLKEAKTWTTAANTAAFFRERLNEGVFVYGFYVAIIHSPMGERLVLPPLYEVTPHMFTNTEIIQQAYSAKMKQVPGKFRMSYTGSERNPEQRVGYFGEDIGLNVHHVTWHMDFPFWWTESDGARLDRRGELFFWVHHQLTARFDAERLSNNLDMVDELYWDRPIYEGFAPHTTYKYGGEFPSRPDNVRFSDVDDVANIRDMIVYENRIRDAIAHGYVSGPNGEVISLRGEDGIDILGNVIESSEYSPNQEYYGALHNLAHIILGRQGDPHGKFDMPPGVMEHFETATRDPAFFRLHKYMNNIFKEYKDTLPPYTEEDVVFKGVSVKSVEVVGKLETFFEDFEFDLSNGVDDAEQIENHELTAVISRLNHEPFSVKVTAQNDNSAASLATVRLFLCPSYDSNGIAFDMESGRWHCVELDKFWTTLSAGENVIERSSSDATTTVPDIPGFKVLQQKVEESLKSGNELGLDEFSRGCGIPNRLLLPKGKRSGMDFKIIVALTDGSEDTDSADAEKLYFTGSHAHCGVHGEKYPDSKPMGYPLDRRIPDQRVFLNAKNLFSLPVKVYHKE